jgi:hypothetical protein
MGVGYKKTEGGPPLALLFQHQSTPTCSQSWIKTNLYIQDIGGLVFSFLVLKNKHEDQTVIRSPVARLISKKKCFPLKKQENFLKVPSENVSSIVSAQQVARTARFV